MRRATIAVVDMLSPSATAKTRVEDRLGQANGGNRVRSEPAHKKNVYHRKERLQHHLQHHGNGEAEDCPVQVARGVVLVAASQGFADRIPKAGLQSLP